jgi:alpha-tubulin suppressor-like RCC1 family protein
MLGAGALLNALRLLMHRFFGLLVMTQGVLALASCGGGGESGAPSAPPPSVASFVSVTAGGAHTCALTASGAAYCWGRGESGQLGASPPTSCVLDSGALPCSLVPLVVQGGLAFTQVVGGGGHTCALTRDGSAYCWGNNGSGQIGNGTMTNTSVPVAVSGGLTFASIDAGVSHTCGVTSSGTAYCWGRNDRGQLGDGTTTTRLVPVAVSGGLTFQLVTAGGFDIGHTCGLTSGGAALCWGDNERGQLGSGTSDLTAHPAPAQVSGGFTFAALTAGLGRHTCGLTGTGAAFCWGENTFGALGNGSTTDGPVPTAVSGGLAYAQLRAGGFIGHTCGLTSSGAAFCWGENERGQVGDDSTLDKLTPSAVAGALTFSSLDAGFRHTCGRASGGALYCWGSGAAGQLGTNSTSQSAVPAKVFGQS